MELVVQGLWKLDTSRGHLQHAPTVAEIGEDEERSGEGCLRPCEGQERAFHFSSRAPWTNTLRVEYVRF